jgi:hypothetical protein
MKHIKETLLCRLGDEDGKIYSSDVLDKIIGAAVTMVGNGSEKLIFQQALVMCLGRMALISKSQETIVNNDGIVYAPPAVSEMCFAQYNQEMASLRDMMNNK